MRGEGISPTVRLGIRRAIRNAPRAHPFIAKFCEAYPTIMTLDEYPLGEVSNGDVPPLEEAATLANGKPKDHAKNERYLQWWAAYPRKDTGPKGPYKHWPHPMPDELFETIMARLAEFVASEQWQDPEKVPMGTTWLNQRRWEGVVVKKGGGSKAANALPAKPGKYANISERVQTDG